MFLNFPLFIWNLSRLCYSVFVLIFLFVSCFLFPFRFSSSFPLFRSAFSCWAFALLTSFLYLLFLLLPASLPSLFWFFHCHCPHFSFTHVCPLRGGYENSLLIFLCYVIRIYLLNPGVTLINEWSYWRFKCYKSWFSLSISFTYTSQVTGLGTSLTITLNGRDDEV